MADITFGGKEYRDSVHTVFILGSDRDAEERKNIPCTLLG